MATVKWATPNTVETLLTTELNSLANGAAAVSGEVDNSSGLYTHADFEFVLGNANTLGGFVSLFIALAEDGTNYEDTALSTYGALSFGSTLQLIGTINPNTASIRKIIRGVSIPPVKFKVVLLNGAFAFAGSGNTVKMVRYGVGVA